MPAPAICELTGTVYSGRDTDDVASLPAPFPRKYLTVTPLSITGSLLSTKAFNVPSASDGTFAFGLYQGAAYNIKGEVAGYNGHNGTNVTIPVAASATLEGLTSVTTYPVTGATVQNEGVALPSLIGTFNFAGVGVDVTQSSGGVALVTIPGSSFVNQNANLVFAGPASGAAAAPAFRSLVALDIPDLSAVYSVSAHSHTFASLTSKPTTLSGYGITDAVPSTRQVNGHPLSADVTVTPTDLGLVIGTNVQTWSADLDAIDALAGNSGFLTKTALNTWSLDTTVYASQAYADSLVVGLLDDRGNYDASVNTFPASGGSGGAGAILKGDLWTVSVGGTLGGTPVTAGDLVRAIVDTPGQTAGNWAVSETNIGYVPLNAALANGAIYIGNGSGVGAAVTPSGDVTIDNLGVTAIGLTKVTNGMLAGSIALSKLSITGTPDGTKYLRDDGSWQTVSAGIALGDSPTWTGVHTFAPTLRSSGVAPYLKITTPADTGQTANTEFPGVVFGGDAAFATVVRTGADGTTYALQREYVFVPPTYAFAGATTVTQAVSLYTASPVVGSNATFTSGYGALFEASAAAHIPLALKGAGSQSGDFFRAIDSTNAILMRISSAGKLFAPDSGYSFTGATTTQMTNFGNALIFYANNAQAFYITSTTVQVSGAHLFGWNATLPTSTFDTAFGRSAAGIIEANNGTAGAGGALLVRGAGAVNGQAMTINSTSELVTLSTSGATTDSTANLLPANAIILSVTYRVTTSIAGVDSTALQVGDPTTALRFGTGATLTAGATVVGLSHLQGGVATDAAGPIQVAAAKVRLTLAGGGDNTPSAGIVRVTVHYINLGAATS